ncbi:glycosyl transferase family 1 [Flavobacterium magnum]|uniref:Glycosyl transferase family 1 n=1 Tax=Flavobacterium magnum TaxID=2162713 RepID=A0A2S0RFT5_9FLAO|nr:glycosyltransferase [Flavobacterium magnum]AWA29951.1 glycosyl transferase family 1 [Flavobacterium magnum]
MKQKKTILFLGESYRADAITWMNGLREFGDFDIVAWELKSSNVGLNRVKRLFEFKLALWSIRRLVRKHRPDMVIAERTTSYGFLAALCGVKPVAIAQQGRTDLWPEQSLLLPLKRVIQHHAFSKADLIHAWGPVMTISMREANVNMDKVMVLPKGIDLESFAFREVRSEVIQAIVTRSLLPEYRHDVILKAFDILNRNGTDFVLTIVGDGKELHNLKNLAQKLKIDHKVIFTGRIDNRELPALLQQSNYYISMPITEGVSASLFEAMAAGCYPLVTDIPGNQSWIKHRGNGQLIATDDAQMLAGELLWATQNSETIQTAIKNNRKFVEEHADYKVNMKVIAERYHELINNFKGN